MVVKSQIVLFLYDELINHRRINALQIMNEYEISRRTFHRYIAEINAFLCNTYHNQEVVFDRDSKTYYLK